MGVFKRWLPLVASCLLATGCSMATLGYEFFPTWALWQIDGYLSMDSDQKAIAQRRLSELHRWHRQSQLPNYVDFIKSVRQQPLTSATVEEAARIRRQAIGAWQPVAEAVAPGLAEVLLTVTPAQIERIKERFAKENRKIRDEYLPSASLGIFGRKDADTAAGVSDEQGAERRKAQLQAQLQARQEARAGRLKKRVEYFLGNLNESQEQLLRELSDQQPSHEELFLAEREARQQRFLALVAKLQTGQTSKAEAESLCKTFLSGLWVSQEPNRRQRLEETSRQNDTLTSRIVKTATVDQRAHLIDRLKDWERNFARMAGID